MRTPTLARIAALALAAIAVLAACGTDSNSAGPTPGTAPTTTTTTTTTAPPLDSITYLAFGDSNVYGVPSECDNCTTAQTLIRDQLAAATGLPVTLIDGTQHNRLRTSMLLDEVRRDDWSERADIPPVRATMSPRAAIDAADVISIFVGYNDLPWTTDNYHCGPVYDAACIAKVATGYGTDLDDILTEIDEIRARPTAVRVIGPFNDLLGGEQYNPIWWYREEFIAQGLTGGRDLIAAMNRAVCDAAAAHHGSTCIDISKTMNGPDGTRGMSPGYFKPLAGDMNQRGQDETAAAVMAAGFDELLPAPS